MEIIFFDLVYISYWALQLPLQGSNPLQLNATLGFLCLVWEGFYHCYFWRYNLDLMSSISFSYNLDFFLFSSCLDSYILLLYNLCNLINLEINELWVLGCRENCLKDKIRVWSKRFIRGGNVDWWKHTLVLSMQAEGSSSRTGHGLLLLLWRLYTRAQWPGRFSTRSFLGVSELRR